MNIDDLVWHVEYAEEAEIIDEDEFTEQFYVEFMDGEREWVKAELLMVRRDPKEYEEAIL